MSKIGNLTILTLALILVVGIMLIGCGDKEEAAPAPTSISCVENYEAALAMAKEKDQRVFIDFYTDWCYWCKVLDTSTYADPSVIAMSADLVFAKINAEVDTLIAQKYGVTGYPTLILMENDGTEIERIVGYLPPIEFKEEVTNYLNGIGTLGDLLEKSKTEPTGDVLYAIGDKYSGRGMYTKAIDYMAKVVELDPKNNDSLTVDARLAIGEIHSRMANYDKADEYYNGLIKEFNGAELAKKAMFALGDNCLYKDDLPKAAEHYNKVLKAFDGEQVALDAMFRLGYIHRAQGDTVNAIQCYEDILAKYPDNEDTVNAHRYLKQLTAVPETTEGN